MMKKYTRQTSGQDEAVKVERQISRQYSRQQSNPDATSPTPAVSKKEEETKEAEEVNTIYFSASVFIVLFIDT